PCARGPCPACRSPAPPPAPPRPRASSGRAARPRAGAACPRPPLTRLEPPSGIVRMDDPLCHALQVTRRIFAVQHRTASSLFVSGTRRRGVRAQGGRTHYLPELLQDICRLQLEGDLFQGGSQMACTMASTSAASNASLRSSMEVAPSDLPPCA